MNTYMIDLYSGNYFPGFALPLHDMYEHGFRAACIKCSMGGGNDYAWVGGKQFDTVQWYADYFRAGGFDVALYHWTDPTVALQPQIVRFADQCKRIGVTVGFLDWEMYWPDWTKYYNHEAQPDIPAAKIINAATVMLAAPELQFLRQLEIYTYAWFPSDHAKLTTWPFKKRKPWIACYPPLPVEHVICETWPEFEAWVPTGSPITSGGGRPAGLGLTDWSFWQIQSRIHLPGVAANYDISVWNGDEASYNLWAGKTPPKPPQTFQGLDAAGKDDLLKRAGQKTNLVDANGFLTY